MGRADPAVLRGVRNAAVTTTPACPRLPADLRSTLRRLRSAGRGTRITIAGLFLLAGVIRVILVAAAQPVLVSDARDYHVLARNLAAGRGYVQVYTGETAAFAGFTFRAFRPPGYPVFLAVLHGALGWQPRVALAANVPADLVTQACGLLIAAALLGTGPAVFVQALLALHVLWTPNAMTESLHSALFALVVLLLVFGRPLGRPRDALLLGLLAAAALFIRPVTLCVYPVMLWQFVRHLRRDGSAVRSVLPLLLIGLPAGVTLSAWAARNYRLFGEPVLFTTNLGHHNAYDFGIPADRAYAALRAEGLNEAQINQALLRAEWDIARAHPRAWLVTYAERAAALFSLAPAWELRHVLWPRVLPVEPEVPSGRRLVGWLYRASYAQYYATYALAAGGAVLLLVRRGPHGLSGLLGLAVAYVLVHAFFSRGDIRLVAPLYPVMCLFAGACWHELAGRLRPAATGS